MAAAGEAITGDGQGQEYVNTWLVITVEELRAWVKF
jgi:hypothetical protein